MWIRIALLVLLAASAVLTYATGLHEKLSVANLRELVNGAGPWGPLLFVLLFGLEGLGFPGILLMMTAVAVWSPWQAFLLCWLGAQLAGVVGFGFARGVGRGWIAERLPSRMRRFEAHVEERGVRTVIVVRLLFFLAPYAHWALGLSPVRVRDFLVGSAIGFAPAMLVVCLTGAAAFTWLAEQPSELWMAMGALFLVAALLWRFAMARRRASESVARSD